jgi:hypothetical protein
MSTEKFAERVLGPVENGDWLRADGGILEERHYRRCLSPYFNTLP